MALKNGQSSDFPPGDISQRVTIAVFQPTLTSATDKNKFLENLVNASSSALPTLLTKLASGQEKFVHQGFIQCVRCTSNALNPLYVENYVSCGHEATAHQMFTDSSCTLSCSNRECRIDLAMALNFKEFASAMFYMLLKQMNPELPLGQYLNCAKAPPHFKGEHPWSEELRKLGVVAFHTKLVGQTRVSSDNQYFGLVLFPEMNTMVNCDGFDNWLRFLQVHHHQMIKEGLQRASSFGLGPRPETGSATLVNQR
jgi:hypothetical protein